MEFAAEQMAPEAQRAALRLNLKFPDYNPYHSILARLFEIIHAIEACLDCLREAPEEEEVISYEVKGGEPPPLSKPRKAHLFITTA